MDGWMDGWMEGGRGTSSSKVGERKGGVHREREDGMGGREERQFLDPLTSTLMH